jgi:hypothetical protein
MHDGSNGILDQSSVKASRRSSSVTAGVRSASKVRLRERLAQEEEPS